MKNLQVNFTNGNSIVYSTTNVHQNTRTRTREEVMGNFCLLRFILITLWQLWVQSSIKSHGIINVDAGSSALKLGLQDIEKKNQQYILKYI